MLVSEILALMEELKIHPRKRWGQNFLTNERLVKKILQGFEELQKSSLENRSSDSKNQGSNPLRSSIIEIGPGLGALTRGLRENHPLLIELDPTLARWWKDQGFSVRQEDALRMNWAPLFNTLPRPLFLISNLPYQIASSLIIDRTLDPYPLDGMVLMFQKEVAQKIRTSLGLLSIFIRTYWEVSLLGEAGPKDFFPVPQVASQILTFRPKSPSAREKLPPPKLFLELLKLGFRQPRKYLISNLSLKYKQRDQLLTFYEREQLKTQLRPSELQPTQWIKLFQFLNGP